jgi:methionyl-tRNA formyltransferase
VTLPRYVVAASRPWYADFAERLTVRTGREFQLITNESDLSAERLRKIAPRYVFFPHWSKKIPADVFTAFECVIFHMTDLPFGRGGSPLQNLIARGFNETKISALRCVAELDAGPIYMKRPLQLNGRAQEIYERAAGIIEDMIAEMVATEPQPVPQAGEVTVFRRRGPADSNLARVETLTEAFDLIRMLDADGYPHAYLETDRLRLEFRHASDADQLTAEVRITLRNPEGTR